MRPAPRRSTLFPYTTLFRSPQGVIQVADREIPVRAIQTRSERLKDAIDQAYLEKYKTPGSIKYARDLGRAKSRATTRSEEHTSELQSLRHLVCRLLLEKKKK